MCTGTCWQGGWCGRWGSVSRPSRSAARTTSPGVLDPGRAAILPAGAIVLDGVLRAVGATTVTVSDHGVRHAYLRERLRALGVAADLGALWG